MCQNERVRTLLFVFVLFQVLSIVKGQLLIHSFTNKTSVSPWTTYIGSATATINLSLKENSYARLSFNNSGPSINAHATFKFPTPLTFNYLTFKGRICDPMTRFAFQVLDSNNQYFSWGYHARPFHQQDSEWFTQKIFLNPNIAGKSCNGNCSLSSIIGFPIIRFSIIGYLNSNSWKNNGCFDFTDVRVWNSTQNITIDNNSTIIEPPLKGDFAKRTSIQIGGSVDVAKPIWDDIISIGFSYTRIGVDWSSTEKKTRGNYDFTYYNNLQRNITGIKKIYCLQPPTTHALYGKFDVSNSSLDAFSNFSLAVAKRFNDSIIEIINEPDLGGITAYNYSIIARSVIENIRSVLPNATVFTGGLSTYTYQYLHDILGAATSYSGIGLHLYGPGLYGIHVGKMVEHTRTVRYIVNSQLNNSDFNYNPPQIYDTEWGHSSTDFDPTGQSNGHHPLALYRQAINVAYNLLSTVALGYPLINLFNWRDKGTDVTDRELNFGVVFNNYTDKPAATALRQVFSVYRNRSFEGFIDMPEPNMFCGMKFVGANDTVYVVWALEYNVTTTILTNRSSSVLDMFGNRLSTIGTFNLSEDQGPIYIYFNTTQSSSVVPTASSITPAYSKTIPQATSSKVLSSANSISIPPLVAIILFLYLIFT